MSAMDFAQALGGAPGGGPGALGGQGPPPPGGPDPSAGPPDATGADQGGDQSGGDTGFANSLEALSVAEEALQAFIQMDPDHSDRAIAAQCLQNVIKLQAANRDNASSGGLMSMARAISGGPGANAGLAGGSY